MTDKNLRELEVLRRMNYEFEQYYSLLRLMRVDLEQVINNFTAISDVHNPRLKAHTLPSSKGQSQT